MNNLGNIQKSLKLYDSALESYRQALALKPNYPEPYVNRGNLLLFLGYPEKALEEFKKALQLNPNHHIAIKGLCTNLIVLERYEEAIAVCERLQLLTPDSPEPLAAKAKVIELTGDKQAAYELLKPLIKNHPDNPKVADAFAAVCDLDGRRDEAIIMIEHILNNPAQPLDPLVETGMRFAIAKLYDKTGDYENAFTHYQRANELKKQPYDLKLHKQYINHIISHYSKDTLKTAPSATFDSKRTLFIVGMPRSDTSLTEQILASHPQICGAGELSDLANIITELPRYLEEPTPYPQFQPQLNTALCNQMAQSYLDKLASISSDSTYVSDKMPQNYHYLGLISKLFPDVHIIHCRRDPRDTALSCYFQEFERGQKFSYDLTTIAGHYQQYEKLMDHWHETLEIPILNIQYEDMVNNQEQETRKMLDFLDLP